MGKLYTIGNSFTECDAAVGCAVVDVSAGVVYLVDSVVFVVVVV